MKIAIVILRLLIGVPFLVFGLNKFLGFLEMPPMEGVAGEFMGILFQSGYLYVVGLIEVVAGALLITGLFVPLALVLIFPVCVNIVLFHLLLADGAGIGLGLGLTILTVILMLLNIGSYSKMLRIRPPAKKTG